RRVARHRPYVCRILLDASRMGTSTLGVVWLNDCVSAARRFQLLDECVLEFFHCCCRGSTGCWSMASPQNATACEGCSLDGSGARHSREQPPLRRTCTGRANRDSVAGV